MGPLRIASGVVLALTVGCTGSHARDDAGVEPIDVGAISDTVDAGGAVDAPDVAPDAWTIPWTEEARLMPPDTAPPSYFGQTIAFSAEGDRVLVGAARDYFMRTEPGHAYVFVREGTTWSLEATLTSMGIDGAFGTSVALSADGARAIVGAPNTERGSAFVFSRTGSTWIEEAILDPAVEDFGSSVAVDGAGSRAFVGALRAAPERSGVRVYRRVGTSWVEEAVLAPRPGRATGLSLATNATGDAVLTSDWVEVSAYRRTGDAWTFDAQLVGDGIAGFGHALALSSSGERAVVGADGFASGLRGRAYLYTRSDATWVLETILERDGAADPMELDQFGISVALTADGRRALIGANTDGPLGSASVFTLRGTGWTREAVLRAVDTYGAGFSVGLSADGSRALMGGGYTLPASVRVFTLAL